MIPLKDDIPSRSVPFVTVILISLNVLVFLYQVALGDAEPAPGRPSPSQAFIFEFGATPCRLSGGCPTPGDFPHPAVTVFTAMFMHGGLLHILGNMLYLWIFGDNVEDVLGHVRFLILYLASGAAAAIAQTLSDPSSRIPMVGASGAVSGVLGAYLLLFPYASVLTLLMFGFFWRVVSVPAVIVLGFWIVVQFVSGYLTFSAAAAGRGETGGIAWFAHIGGFLVGMLLLALLRPRRQSARL